MCQSREFIQWYAIVTVMFHLFEIIAKIRAARSNFTGFLLFEVIAFAELAMSVYLFLSMQKFSKPMLQHYLTALKCWAVFCVAMALVSILSVKLLHYDILDVHEVLLDEVYSGNGKKQRLYSSRASLVAIVLFKAAQRDYRTDDVFTKEVKEDIIMLAIAVTALCELCYTAFLYWRLRLFYHTMPEEGALLSPGAIEYQPEYSAQTQYGVQPQYASPPKSPLHGTSPQPGVLPQHNVSPQVYSHHDHKPQAAAPAYAPAQLSPRNEGASHHHIAKAPMSGPTDHQ